MFDGFTEGAFRPLTTRGIELRTCKPMGARVSINHDDEKSYVFDYHDVKGNIIAQHTYHIDHYDKLFTWAGQPQAALLFGQNNWGTPSRPKRLVICKGELDALSIAQVFSMKWQVIAIPGYRFAIEAIKRNYEWIDKFGEIVLAFDKTEAGLATIEEMSTMFPAGKIKVMEYGEYNDANHMLMDFKDKQISKAIYDSKDYRPDGIVFGEELWEDIISAPPTGFSTPYTLLNEKMQGFRKGRIFLFTAGAGLGKSTLAHEIGYHFLTKHKQKVGAMALEEPRKRLGERYLAIKMNRQLHVDREGISEKDLRAAYDATINNKNFCLYDHRGSKDIKTLLAKIRFMVVALGMEWIILDHISIVVSGTEEIAESERKTIDRLMTGLSSMVEELEFGLIAIVHLKRKGGDRSKSYNEGRQVSLGDLRGSGGLEQMAHVVISMERNQQDEETKHFSKLRLLKDRDIGDTGEAGIIEYNPITGRLLESDHNPFVKSPFEDDAKGDF